MFLTAHFDINEKNEVCTGTLEFNNNIITATADGETIFTACVERDNELVLRTYVGCGSLEITEINSHSDMSNSISVCRFSMSCAEEIGEFCKVINYYLHTGEETEMSTADFKTCPKCGRHYAKGMKTCLFCAKKTYLAKRLVEIAKPYAPSLLFSVIFIMLSSACYSLSPVVNQYLVDNYLYNTDISKESALHGIVICAIVLGLTQVVSKIFGIISQRKANRTSGDISNDLRLMVYDKIQRLSTASVSKKTSGDLMKRVSRDTETVKNFITEQGIYAVEKLAMFIVILIILINISPVLTLIIFVPVPFVVYAIGKFWSIIRVRYERQWRCGSRENSILHDIIKGIRVVKTFGSEEREIAKFSSVSKKLADVSTSNEHLWALTFPVLMFFIGIGEFLVLYFGGRMVINGSITVGELLEFNLFLSYIYNPLRWVSTIPRKLGEVATSLIKIFEIIDEKDDIENTNTPVPAKVDGDIVFTNVQFGYKAYEPVLKDINLTVKKGEMIGLVGHSGAGKSTLINLIMRLYDTDIGSITIGGNDIRNMNQQEFRGQIGVVFQETFLFTGSIYDNIAYARPNAEPCEIIAAAKAANAHDFIMKLPDGYNTIIGEDGHTLSGGERQRVSIARAVLRNPAILILDEATSALDPETEEAIQNALSKLVKGRTTFAIAHRLSTLRNADRLVVIEKGKIAETGTHDELLLEDGIYAHLVSAQRQTSKLTGENQ